MASDETTPGADAPPEQSTMQAAAAKAGDSEPLSEEEISKSLLMQVGIVGVIVFLILLAVFFGAI